MRIGGVLSRITHGVNGRRILEGIIAGEACADTLGGLSWHVRKKLGLLGDALSFELDMQARWILGDLLDRFDSDTARIEAANRRMEAALAPYEAQVRLLETLPGVSRDSAMAILVELGPDMSVFASARHCAAWTGICPGNNESAGKRRSGRIRRGNPILRAILVACAHAAVRTRGCQFQTWHQAVKSRREAAAGASGVRPHAPTLRKLSEMARPARRLPPGKAKRKRHVDTDRKISASIAATGHPTQNPNTETIGFRQ